MRSRKMMAGACAVLALFANTAASAAAVAPQVQTISPLIAVCGAVVSGAAAAAAQGQSGCVLPVNEPLPAPAVGAAAVPPAAPHWDLGTSILLGLGGLFLVAGIVSLFNDDNNAENVPVSPA